MTVMILVLNELAPFLEAMIHKHAFSARPFRFKKKILTQGEK